MTIGNKTVAVLAVAIILVVALVLLPFGKADATGGNGQDKVGVCHRTNSDTNPYVYIEVPQDEANGHITGTSNQHNGSGRWKSDGVYRGVPHKAGDPKNDYLAPNGAGDCQDTQVPPKDEPVTPAVTAVDNCGVLTDSVTGVVSEGYTSVTTNSGLVYTTVFTAEPGFVLTSVDPIVTTLTDVACPTETPTTNPPVPTETPTVPTETPTVPTETPEVPVDTETPDPETPVNTPQPPKETPNPPKDVQVIACVNGVWVTTVNGEVISESGTCNATPENSVPQTFSETGL